MFHFFCQGFLYQKYMRLKQTFITPKKAGKTHWNAYTSTQQTAHTSSNRHADVSVGAEQAIRILKFTTKKLFKQMRLIYQNTCFPPNKNQFIYNAIQQFCMNEQDWSDGEAKWNCCNICAQSARKKKTHALLRRLPTYAYKITSFAYFYPFSMLILLSILRWKKFIRLNRKQKK